MRIKLTLQTNKLLIMVVFVTHSITVYRVVERPEKVALPERYDSLQFTRRHGIIRAAEVTFASTFNRVPGLPRASRQEMLVPFWRLALHLSG